MWNRGDAKLFLTCVLNQRFLVSKIVLLMILISIVSMIVLKKHTGNNSLDNAANLLSNSPYENTNFEWSYVHPQDVINPVRALKTSKSTDMYLIMLLKILLFPLPK